MGVQGVELRPVGPADIGAVGELIRRAEAHDRVPRALSDDELAQDLAAPHLSLEDDTRLAVRAGEVVGWAQVWNPPARHRLERAELNGEVAPEHRGTGVGRALLAWSVTRGRQRLLSRTHALPRYLRAHAYDWLDERHRLYRRFGFEAVRWHEELIRPLAGLPPVTVPAGVSLLPWSAEREEEVRGVRNAAFADHWGSTVVEPGQWLDFVRGHGARPDLSVIAVDDGTGEVIGLCVNQSYPEDEAVTGRRDAWIANVATARRARGRGVASAMIARSLAAFAAAGMSHALLDVDTDNPTGAARLYRDLGFEPLHRSTTFQVEVVGPG